MSFENISPLIIVILVVLLLTIVGSLVFTFFLSNFIRKRMRSTIHLSQAEQPVSTGIPRPGQPVPQSLKAHSHFIKRAHCNQCGAAKSLPSKTAYVYCDYCSALMDYDFRLANANTNAALTNTVYHRLISRVQAPLSAAKAHQDWDTVRQIYQNIYREWIQECPLAVSPRAEHDEVFLEQMVVYLTESALTKDQDPDQEPLEAEMQRLSATLGRTPRLDGAWRVSGPFWEYAQTFKKQMELVYERMEENGVLSLDPDNAPRGVPIQMEFSTFVQGWLPHLSSEDGQRLLRFYGLSGEYDEVSPLKTDKRQCGSCGSEMQVLPDARQVICDTCYHPIDVESRPLPCHNCAAPLSLPVGADGIACPYCDTEIRRV